MEYQINLDAYNYSVFLRCLSIFKNICNDVDIRGGIIRTRTNDSATIFEVDLTSIIGVANLQIANLKNKLGMLKALSGQEINISTTDESCSFSNKYTFIISKNLSSEFLDNKYIPEEDLRRFFIINRENIILSTDISKTISDRIKNISSKSIKDRNIQVELSKDNASLSIKKAAENYYTKLLSRIYNNKGLNHRANLSITPFVFDHDGEIKFEMFASDDDLVINKFSTAISDIIIYGYGRAFLMPIEVGDAPTDIPPEIK